MAAGAGGVDDGKSPGGAHSVCAMHWGVRRVRGCNLRNEVAAVLQRGFALETFTAAARGTRRVVAVGGERDGADVGSEERAACG
jgi:hypothetical protein